MQIRKLFLLAALGLCSLASSAQITLSPMYDAAESKATDGQKAIVEARLRSVITSMKLVSGYNSRFVLACKTVPLQTEVSGTKMVQQISATFAVGDARTKTCFGTSIVEFTGIGNTEEQALTNALKNIKNSPQLRKLVDKSKQRIIDYYNNNAASIIRKAQTLVSGKQYEQALFELCAIPEDCNLYEQALEMMEKVYDAAYSDGSVQLDRTELAAACRKLADEYATNNCPESDSSLGWW